jgi:ElaB/YqjD/DUF883 family membrane-anchored ribosome-binding protein
MALNEEIQARIDELRDKYDELMEEVAFTDVTDQLGEVATQIEGLPGIINGIRDRGYVYASFLEHKAETLGEQWGAIYDQINNAISEELEKAQDEMGDVDRLWRRMDNLLASQGDTPDQPHKSLSSQLQKMVEKQEKSDIKSKLASVAAAQKPQSSLSKLSSLAAAASAKAEKEDDGDGDIEALADRLERAMDRMSTALSGAKTRIEGLYGQVPSNVSQTLSQIRQIEGYLKQADGATFEWLAGENIYLAVEAEWKKTGKGKDDPDGNLYITDQRIIMEQDEKKGGFIGIGGKKEQGLLWEAPIGSIEDARPEKKGMLGGIDLIHLRMGSGAPFAETTIEVKGGINAEMFAGQLRRAASGEIERERGVDPDPAEVEALADAPTMCAVCGATFDQPVTRGMTQLECTYCGSVVRLGAS